MDTGQKEMVRKCLGKKQTDCLQASDHANTRWECNFETQNKDEYNKHSKNIAKRVKWRDLVDNIKPDKEGWYRCVYYSTDRHHVEGHYQKGSEMTSSPAAPGGVDYYRGANPYAMNDWRAYPGMAAAAAAQKKMGKRWGYGSKPEDEDDENISADVADREVKKFRQDSNLMGYGDSQGEGDKDEHYPYLLQDTMKTEELMETIERRLELNHEMTKQANDKLIEAGYVNVGNLRAIKREDFAKLGLPIAVEEEIKTQITNTSRSMYNTYMYPMMHPAYSYMFSQGGFGGNQYAAWPGFSQMGGGMYYNQVQPNYDTSDNVLGEGEVDKKEKDENGGIVTVPMGNGLPAVEHPAGSVTQLDTSNADMSHVNANSHVASPLVALSMASSGHGVPDQHVMSDQHMPDQHVMHQQHMADGHQQHIQEQLPIVTESKVEEPKEEK
eukprot:TRINITY_DN2009_c0_g1_i2.p1 TRINITY_DN2009_c0_g1~~TRINITY_DN2009_c0_g1_i2.p1  ORF type:complete len:439 (+),score=139.87 TRINITY_DN2009_c0_g1_i2:109-1425(+)